MDDEGEPIGAMLDGLGVTAHLPEGALVSSAVVLLAAVGADGREMVKLAWSGGQSWVTRRGLLEVALDGERVPPSGWDDD